VYALPNIGKSCLWHIRWTREGENRSEGDMSVSGISQLSGAQGSWFNSINRTQEDSGSADYEKLTEKIFSDRDSDADGLLTAEELGVTQERFADMDTDGDGYVSSEEMAQHLSQHDSNSLFMRVAHAMVQEQDADGDGKISKSETQLSDDLFESYDKDGDGSLTESEIAAALGEHRKEFETAMQESMDAQGAEGQANDRPGSFPLTEMDSDSSSGSSNSDNILQDLNGDGIISPEEVQAILEHGVAKARAMVASGELEIKPVGDQEEGAESVSGAAKAKEPEKAHHGKMDGPPWLRRKALQAYEGRMGELMNKVLGGSDSDTSALPSSTDLVGAEAATTIAQTIGSGEALSTFI